MYTIAELKVLAQAYVAKTGMTLSRLGATAAGNNRLFERLNDGLGANAQTIERASLWFDDNWPVGLAWPLPVPEVPKRPVRRRA